MCVRSFSLLLTATPQFHHLKWTCWDRLEVPAGQPERTLESLLAHIQVCPSSAQHPGQVPQAPDPYLSRRDKD